MRKQQRLLTGLLIACLAASGAAAQTKKGLLWKATSGDNTVYLLGSVHLGSKAMYPLPKEFEDAFAASQTLIVEIDLNKMDMQAMQAIMLSKGMYMGDDSLWDHVSPDTRKQLEAFCDKYQLPSMMLAKMKPWFAAITVATIPMLKSGMDPGLGIDKYFMDRAAKDGEKKNIVEIESAEWQLNLLSGFSDELQGRFLASAIEQANKAIEQGKRIQELWIAGDTAKLEAAMKEDPGPPEVEKALLQDRNPHMADVAEQYLKGKGRALVVVGAAHLIGKDGVAAILQQRGYKVEQVTLSK